MTFRRLWRYLLSLGFEETEAKVDRKRVLYHSPSKTVLLFSDRGPNEPVRPADFLSVLVRLEYQGLASDEALAELRQGRLPKAGSLQDHDANQVVLVVSQRRGLLLQRPSRLF
jgi:hypothetical protein